MYPAKINVLIAEDNKELSLTIQEFLSSQNNFNIVGICANGKETLEIIRTNKIDLLILDLIMPLLDGLEVLEKLNELEIRNPIKIIVLSSVSGDKITQRALQLGADFYVVKPFDMNVLVERIKQIFDNVAMTNINEMITNELERVQGKTKENEDFELDVKITDIIKSLSMPAHIKGYIYLRTALRLVINNFDKISVTKELYPEIARINNTTSSKVERAIRHGIQVVWSRGNIDLFSRLFSYNTDKCKRKPTNSEFIATIAEILRRENKRNFI